MKRWKFSSEMVKQGSPRKAAEAAGISTQAGYQMLTQPDIKSYIEEGLSKAAEAAGLSKKWVLVKLKEVVERCMQARPVMDRQGNETGQWEFDSSGANRALELIARHLRLLGDDDSAAAQIGGAVMRLLAQEAQAGRIIPNTNVSESIDGQVVPTDSGPIQEKRDGTETSLQAIDPPPQTHTASAPPHL